MERNREGKRLLNMETSSSTSGLSKRRQTPTPTVARDSVGKRERDLSILLNNRRKRRSTIRQHEQQGDEEERPEEEHDEYEVDETDEDLPRQLVPASVPRKARSASTKRLQRKTWFCPGGGFEFDSLSVRKKKTKVSRPKTRLPNKETSSSVQEDIEIEIAEVLFGLMKQSSSKDATESNLTNGRTSNLAQNCGLARVDSKTQEKLEDDTTSTPTTPIQDSSVKHETHQQPTQMDMELTCKLDKTSVPKVSPDLTASKGSPELQEDKEAVEQSKSESVPEEESVVTTKENSLSVKEDSASCTNLILEFQDSKLIKVTSIVPEIKGKGEEKKFEIDLMAPPPMASPEPYGCVDSSSVCKPTIQLVEKKMENMVRDEEQVERLVKKEPVVGIEVKKMKAHEGKPELRLHLEKSNHDSNNDMTKLQQKHQSKATISKLETTAKSSSVPIPIAVPGWPSGLPPVGYMPPFQTVIPMDNSAASSTAQQVQPPFLLSQPHPKRCKTHHYIASNIHLHQQLTKMNHFLPPPAAGTAALCGNISNNSHSMPSRSFPILNTKTTQDKGQIVANIPVFTKEDRSSEGANFIDMVQKKQVVPHQCPQPAQAGNLLHGPAFVFPLTQHQAPTAPTGNQKDWPTKSTASNHIASLSTKAIAGVATNPSILPAAALSFNYSNMAANEAPYLTILPNKGYSFPMSTPLGNPQALKGGNTAQVLPFYNGSLYSPQMLHSTQFQQQQSHTQPLIQTVYQNANSPSSSSSSHKQPQTWQTQGTQASGNNFLTSTSLQSQQQQKQHMVSRKLETELSGESIQTIAETRAFQSKKSVHGQKFILPLQPNFVLMPSASVSSSDNPSEKQQSKEKSLKSGVETIPSQAFALSFASFNGGSTPSNLNFSSMAQNPAVFQSVPDMTHQGYHVVSVPQSTQKKNHHISEGKTGGSASNSDDRKKVVLGKAPNTGQTLVFDNSVRTLNFTSSPFTGNWPCSITSNTSAAVAVNDSNSQQHQLIQLQKQHILHQHQQQQQQQHPNGASQSKTPTAHNLPSFSSGSKFSNNASIFTQSQSNSSPQSSQWTSSLKMPTTQAPLKSISASNTSILKNVTLHQGRAPQGQISFGGNSKSNLAQGQKTPSSLLVAGSPPSSSNMRTTNAKATYSSVVTALQPQPSENSSTGNGQKSTPVCGRDVPSILSRCPSHLSELKY